MTAYGDATIQKNPEATLVVQVFHPRKGQA
jgi:hypothetical protein